MNMLHIKYAVEIAKCGSINKAAERLLTGQPNLSRAVKELETSLGIKIFERSAKGMTLTPEGEMFMGYAKSILKQVDALEEIFKNGVSVKQRFSISVPRASYISEALVKFSESLGSSEDWEILYKETNSLRAIDNILRDEYNLGIIRYADIYDKYYKSMLEEKKLDCELVAEFKHILVMSHNSPLAYKENITPDDLSGYIEIAHADPYVPSLPQSEVKKSELTDNVHRRIFVFERGSQLALLSSNPKTFMLVSPVPTALLERYRLVQRPCNDGSHIYKDMLIRRKDYTLSQTDKLFIGQLIQTKRETFENIH